MSLIVGLDLSLTGTGIAQGRNYEVAIPFQTFTPPKAKAEKKMITGMPRLHWIVSHVIKYCDSAVNGSADFVVVEDLAFAAHDTNHERAGLACMVRYFLWRREIPYVLVSPTTLKKFVTESGKGEKSMTLKVMYKNFGFDCANDNEADAVGLMLIGKMLAGAYKPANKAQRDVLKTVSKNLTPAAKKAIAKWQASKL